jgi:hypothetical protein
MLQWHDVQHADRRNSHTPGSSAPYDFGSSHSLPAASFASPMIRVVDKQQAVVNTLHSSHHGKPPVANEPLYFSYSNPSSNPMTDDGTIVVDQMNKYHTDRPTMHQKNNYLAPRPSTEIDSGANHAPNEEQLKLICRKLQEEADSWRQKWLASEVQKHGTGRIRSAGPQEHPSSPSSAAGGAGAAPTTCCGHESRKRPSRRSGSELVEPAEQGQGHRAELRALAGERMHSTRRSIVQRLLNLLWVPVSMPGESCDIPPCIYPSPTRTFSFST